MSNDASLAVSSHTVSDYLDCLQVVMVNTTLPANIGSAARAMHTMGLSRLTVVDPKLPIDETSVSHAAGGSELLSSSLITPTLESAISDCQLVFAASSRSRHMPRPVVTPTQAAKIMFDFIDAQAALSADDSNVDTSSAATSNKPNIAILFGREDRGLTNEELAYADYHVQIDANPAYPVLNVASAVQVIASFIFAYAQTHTQTADSLDSDASTDAQSIINVNLRQQWDEPAINQQQLQQLTQRTTDLMVQRGLANNEHLKSLPSRLSRLGSRLQLDQKEYQLLSALIAKLSKD
ncbi:MULTISPECIES: RNA methyltransferase [Psychrobacter]|uniref:RNA methyltransferase n=1 Tax=Psychrobacter TaxID=497 RepID=UPI0008698AEF|nr:MULTISPECIES: RNA methyltransferase [Psychrobacter]MBA6245270.1 RNA methyltransferase [Psychrobacter sp. Urea-trap-18]MBA6285671.1 RNA methyltransferase [Psychrobacter sp. Urea-trap-16]MBA6318918.1 RNA methyltransferase [Psychrobacter sp. Urea-trap-20]MBA6333941.1 RNA methyltransferase [Psychrobacter sp. Urea-trap-19]OEH68887.1 MAG: rRNA methyltransferase [Psychrobacter sp. B29-1]|tara:strand:+ start:875 stop:1756 length:882 start_codon:yes stop_codon:yes gene_type:complete